MLSTIRYTYKMYFSSLPIPCKRPSYIFPTNDIFKRDAGHSEWANKLKDREAGQKRKNTLTSMYINKIKACIQKTKNSNPQSNTILQSIINDAKRDNISSSVIEKWLRTETLALEGKNTFKLYYESPTGIAAIVEMSGPSENYCSSSASSVMKKFGFKFVNHSQDLFTLTGVILGQLMTNCENTYDQALEHAIESNCEEVNKTDDENYEFLCHAGSVEVCKKNLTKLGYDVKNTDIKVTFQDYIEIADEAVLKKLEEIPEKLDHLTGYVRIVYNIK